MKTYKHKIKEIIHKYYKSMNMPPPAGTVEGFVGLMRSYDMVLGMDMSGREHDEELVRSYNYLQDESQSSRNIYMAETMHRRKGSHYIHIPDKDCIDVICSLDISKVELNHVSVPFGSVAWSFPENVDYFWIPPSGVLTSEVTPDDLRDMTNATLRYGWGELKKGSDQGIGVAIVAPDMHGGPSVTSCAEWSIMLSDAYKGPLDTEKVLEHLKHSERMADIAYVHEDDRHDWLERRISVTMFEGFMVRACILLQAKPDALKEGSGILERVHKLKLKKGRQVRVDTKIKRPLHIMGLPKEYREAGKAHWRKIHPRTLHHPRYRRQDEQGNLLPVGEPGKVRMIIVDGCMVKGRMHHVDKEEL